MSLFDSHVHLDDEQFDLDRNEIITSLEDNNVEFVITCADSLSSSKKALSLAEKYDNVYAAAGIHPHNAKDYTINYLDEIKRILEHKKMVAAGEIGLDYHYDFSPRNKQMECMLAQIDIAKQLNMPIIFHIREAFGDFLSLLRQGEIPSKSVMHCYSGSIETAKECLDNGMMISFSGVITFKNANKIREVVNFVSIDKMMIETDCPYMAPVPHRGKRNEPKYVIEVAKTIASIKQMKLQQVIDITRQNAIDFFNINISEEQ